MKNFEQNGFKIDIDESIGLIDAFIASVTFHGQVFHDVPVM